MKGLGVYKEPEIGQEQGAYNSAAFPTEKHGLPSHRGRLYHGRMRKLLSRVPTDRLLLLSILGLAGAAHFLPVVAFHGEPGPAGLSCDRRLIGWEVADAVLAYLACEFPKRAISEQVDWDRWLDFVGCLSNPLFWFGVVALVLSNRLSGRKAGTIAAVAGVLRSVRSHSCPVHRTRAAICGWQAFFC